MAELLNHRLTGEKRDFALLLIHPLGADLSIWDDFVTALDGRVTTLAMDLPGSGSSPGPGRPVGLAEQAEALEALRGALGIEKLCPIGIAVGAMTAATYAAAHPARTSALILTNPTPASAPQALQMLADRAEAVRQGGIAAVLPAAVDRSFLEMPRDERYERYMNRFSAQEPEAYALAVLAAAEADASMALRAIDCPTLLVPGRHDVLLPIERTEAVAKLVPHARIAVMEHAAHFVPYQQPAAFAALVLDFLGREATLA